MKVESTRQDHKLETQRLLSLILNSHEAQGTFNTPSTITTTPTTITPHAKNPYSLRIGLSGKTET